MCYIYKDDQERKELIAKFLASGLEEHEQVGYFVDNMSPAQMREELRGLGLQAPPNLTERDFQILPAQEVYCTNGRFIPEITLQKLREMYAGSLAAGYAGVRVSGEMSWALRGLEGSERLIEYEAQVNVVFKDYPLTAICQYDARRFDGGTLFDVLNVHPMMIIRGRVVHNPYYVQPENLHRHSLLS
jgi:hypothetical protein